MKLSVIIPTYNGARKIPDLLRSLEQQTFTDFETIVVIDGSTDNTVEVIERSQARLKDLRVVSQENKGRAAVRNKGAQLANGELLIFFDDDTILKPDCIERHIQHHHVHPGSIYVGASPINIQDDPHNDFLAYRHHIEETWYTPFKQGLVQVTADRYVFTTQNLSIAKATFLQLQGFDERLTDSEDLDLSLRAFEKKIPIYFDYQAGNWHNDRVNIEGYIKRQKQYSEGRALLGKLRPEYIKQYPKHFTRLQVSRTKKNILRIFRMNKFWRSLLHSRAFLTLVPEKLRYRLYTLIIFSSYI